MRKIKSSLSFIAILQIVNSIQAFGAFQNLDFESANISKYPQPDLGPFPISDVLPGWSAYYGGEQTSYVWYNNRSLGSSLISLFDNNSPDDPYIASMDGNYSASLDARTFPVSIAQTGTIPAGSLSVVFLVRNISEGTLVVTFDGNVLPYVKTWSEPNFDIYNADISSYDGKTGELRFTENSGCNVLDDIQFSTEAVPEPNTLVLSVLGSLLLFWRCHSRTK